MFLNPIYAAAPDHKLLRLDVIGFYGAFMRPSSSFLPFMSLPSSNGRALTPELGEVLCQHQSGTECCVNFTASCYILVRV